MLRTIKRTRFIKGNFKILLSLLSATSWSQAVPGRVAAGLVAERRDSAVCVEPGGQRDRAGRGCCCEGLSQPPEMQSGRLTARGYLAQQLSETG